MIPQLIWSTKPSENGLRIQNNFALIFASPHHLRHPCELWVATQLTRRNLDEEISV
jgi:hypothetical protein